jgi:hypothetical protein
MDVENSGSTVKDTMKSKPYQITISFQPLDTDTGERVPNVLYPTKDPQVLCERQTYYIKGHTNAWLGKNMKMCKTKKWLNDHGEEIEEVFQKINTNIIDFYQFSQDRKVAVCFPGHGIIKDIKNLKTWGFHKYLGCEIIEKWVYDLTAVLQSYHCKHQSLRWFRGYVTGQKYIPKYPEIHELNRMLSGLKRIIFMV